MKIEVIYTETIKPSSPTPDHLRSFKLSLLDQLSPPHNVPLVIFYSADDLNSNNVDHIAISNCLKNSLSETLTLFYPLAGRLQGNANVDCSDDNAVYMEARANVELSEILRNPDMDLLQQFLPFDPYNVRSDKEAPITAIQVIIFACGGIGIGICMSHRVADGATLATFLSAWSSASIGAGKSIAPSLNSALHFPPRDDINVVVPSGVISNKGTLTKRFVFDGERLALLQAKMENSRPTRVEAVTSVIWKAAMAVSREKSGKMTASSILTHVVNIRGRMEPPLPENSLGNLWQLAAARLMEDSNLELHDLVGHLRKAIREIDGNYIRKAQVDDGILKNFESMKQVHQLVSKGEVDFYRFSSWSRFPFYEIDFGFGKPTWVCTTNVPIKNVVILMSTKSGDGIEAWITMAEDDMAKFESNHELLQLVSTNPSS